MAIDERDEAFERLLPVERAARASDAGATSAAHAPLDGGLRPRSMGELLDLAVEVLRRRFAACVGLSALLMLPARAVQPFIGPHTWIGGLERGTPDVALMIYGLAGMMILPALAQMLARAAVVPIAWGELVGERARAGAVLGQALRRFVPLFVLTALVGILTSTGMCVVLVGALFVAWKLACAVPALVVERIGIAQALQRAFDLSGGGLLRFVVLGTVMLIAVTPLNGLPGFAADDGTMRPIVMGWLGVSETAFDILAVPLTSLLLGLGVAIASIASAVYYADCRVRRDGADLRLQLDRIAAQHPAPDAPQRFTKETW